MTAASLTGLGAFSAVTLGFFDWESKEYREISVDEQVEVVSLGPSDGEVSRGEGVTRWASLAG